MSTIKYILLIYFNLLITLKHKCVCNLHKSGKVGLPFEIYDKRLFQINGIEPKNYSLEFRYQTASIENLVEYSYIYISAPSTGWISVTNNTLDIDTYRTGTAHADIQNGINFYVHVHFQGYLSHYYYPNLLGNRKRKEFSYALICSKSKNRQRKFVLYESGERQNGDFLARFQREFVTTSTVTQYFNDSFIKITKIQVIANTTKAIILKNKVQFDEHTFKANVYSITTKPIQIELRIYGLQIN